MGLADTLSCSIKKSISLFMLILIRLSTKYRHVLCGISLEDVEVHFVVVVGFANHKRAVLGC